MRRPRATPAVVKVGSLRDDFIGLSGKIVQTLCDGPRVIYLGDDNCVYSSQPEQMRDVPVSWIVGTFALGHPVAEIQDDLRAVAFDRSTNWILD
jgi:hypothetical protein